MKKVILALFVVLVGLTSSGCGLSAELKQDTAAVLGEQGVMDDYLGTINKVVINQRRIMEAFQQQHPETTELTIDLDAGGTAKVNLQKYIDALKLLEAYPEKLAKAYHALNRAVQTEKGISGFWDQFLRTLEADAVGSIFDRLAK